MESNRDFRRWRSERTADDLQLRWYDSDREMCNAGADTVRAVVGEVTLRGSMNEKSSPALRCATHTMRRAMCGSSTFLPERVSADLRFLALSAGAAPMNVSDRGATVVAMRGSGTELRTAAVGTLRLPVLPGKVARGMQGQ
jgi:hypothetical protein